MANQNASSPKVNHLVILNFSIDITLAYEARSDWLHANRLRALILRVEKFRELDGEDRCLF